MNKLSKILLVIILLLTIALGVMTYYYIYMRDAYISAVEEMIRMVEEDEKENKIQNEIDTENQLDNN